MTKYFTSLSGQRIKAIRLMMSTRNDLQWIYPVRGTPESHLIKDSQALSAPSAEWR